MSRLQLKDWIEGVGIVAIVASLLFVGLQMRQAQDIALSQGNIDNLANNLTLRDAINDNADVWVRGNAGADLDDSEAAVYSNLVRNMNDQVYFTSVRTRRMGMHEVADVVIADFAGYLYDNPGALRVWNAHQELYDRDRGLLAPAAYASRTFDSEVRLQLENLRKKLE